MNPGDLRHVITIQYPAEVQNDAGEMVDSWVDFPSIGAKRRAAVETLTGREYFAAQQTNAERTEKIRIRYEAGITPKMRILFESRILQINAILDNDNRHRELLLMCTEVV